MPIPCRQTFDEGIYVLWFVIVRNEIIIIIIHAFIKCVSINAVEFSQIESAKISQSMVFVFGERK